MARIRTIKPQAFRSRTLAGTDPAVRWTFAGLWCCADDDGRMEDDARLIKADVWPLDDNVTTATVEGYLSVLEDKRVICRYQEAGRSYLHIVNFAEHQKINRKTPSELPGCRADHRSRNGQQSLFEDSLSPHGALTAGREGKGREGNVGVSAHGAPAASRGTRLPESWRPSRELADWARSEHPDVSVDAETAKFIDHWLSKAGSGGVHLDWDRTWKNWIRRAAEYAPRNRDTPAGWAAPTY